MLPRKQSPAHSVAFCSIAELGETKAACWLHSKPTGTGCFPPEEGGVHTFNQEQTRGSHLRHLTGLPKERQPGRGHPNIPGLSSNSKATPVLPGAFEALEKKHDLQVRHKSNPGHEVQHVKTLTDRNYMGVLLPNRSSMMLPALCVITTIHSYVS